MQAEIWLEDKLAKSKTHKTYSIINSNNKEELAKASSSLLLR